MIANEHSPTPAEGPPTKKPWFLVEDGKILLFGLEFGGWGSLLALVASVFSLGLTAYDKFIVDPQPELWAPEQINLACDNRGSGCTENSNVYLRASGVTVINKTSGEHPFTVRSMDAKVSYLGAEGKVVKDICLDWQYLSSISTAGSRREPVGPFEVRSGSPFVQEIEFFPRRKASSDSAETRQNFFVFREMERLIAKGEIKEIAYTFEAEVVGQNKRLTVACRTPVDSDFLNNAGTAGYQLYSRECVANPVAAIASVPPQQCNN